MLLLVSLLFVSQLSVCLCKDCEGSDWFCEATAQCVAYNHTCDGTCYITPYRRQKRDHNGGFNYNNNIYYCALTDKCEAADTPCGDYCHAKKVPAYGPGHQYTFIERFLCEEDSKCYEGMSAENIDCRNKFYNCSSGEHYCEEVGSCQDNSKTCSDYCDDLNDYYSDCERVCLARDHDYCVLSGSCVSRQSVCSDGCEEGSWYCKTSQTCVPVTQPCDGVCVDYSQTGAYWNNTNYKRFLCQEDGECKTYDQLCGETCYSGTDYPFIPYLFCRETASCQPHYDGCTDGCGSDELYCRESGKCQQLSEPCYGQCGLQAVFEDPRQRFYCAQTGTCNTGEQACNGACFGTSSLPHFCTGTDICYSKNPKSSGKQKCDHFQASCLEDEWLCENNCIPLSQPCKQNRPSAGRDGCIENYRGKKYGMALCQDTNTCLHKFTPCNGTCSASYPRLRFCEATASCVNINKSCAGSCLVENRFKCFTEDKCVHKNKVNNGKFDCLDKSDEDLHDEEETRKAIYKLLELHNILLS